MQQKTKKQVILITDGDHVAQHVVEEAARRVGGRCISASGGNPSEIDAPALIELIHDAEGEPVLVMVDDAGTRRKGPGEKLIEQLATEDSIELLGVLAVASHTAKVEGVPVVASVDRNGELISGPVDKDGVPEQMDHQKVEGDTVDVLNRLQVPIVIGIGDLGKQNHADHHANITVRAIREIINRAGSDAN
ncbi:MAG TPA: stage V sporulation protein AE [Firmicutes bacterium]|nr:stage V sporulation protein AE [Bacillota bacterium]HBL51527.1 stage V sporulation protein AE [Bacillota bacterium]